MHHVQNEEHLHATHGFIPHDPFVQSTLDISSYKSWIFWFSSQALCTMTQTLILPSCRQHRYL